MSQLSETAVGTIARALINDRRSLSQDLAFWQARPSGRPLEHDPVRTLMAELQENATALIELSASAAPWLKQRADWPLITNNSPLPAVNNTI